MRKYVVQTEEGSILEYDKENWLSIKRVGRGRRVPEGKVMITLYGAIGKKESIPTERATETEKERANPETGERNKST